ncbi:MAG: LPD28 domain-containing protein [Dysosmobacter sp.]
MTVDARKERFELVEVLGHPMLFTCLRVDRNTVPKGLYLYEVRNDDDQCGTPRGDRPLDHGQPLGHAAVCRHPSQLEPKSGTYQQRLPPVSTRKTTGTTPAIRVRPGHIWTNTC